MKENYRPISILSPVSKLLEKIMYEQINEHMNEYLSPCLCGFRGEYNSQHCLMLMIETLKMALDKRHIGSALLTDLSKAFDCLDISC